jgi:hypothetical protein
LTVLIRHGSNPIRSTPSCNGFERKATTERHVVLDILTSPNTYDCGSANSGSGMTGESGSLQGMAAALLLKTVLCRLTSTPHQQL